ncbi:MAG: DUF2147 domain-containing protein [Bacteroidota bacterium]
MLSFRSLVAVLVLFPICVLSQDVAQEEGIAGRWKTVDDNTGETRSIIVIDVTDGIATGRIDSLFNPTVPNPVCDKCEGDKEGQPIVGLEILWGMKAKGDAWEGGKLLDPENGKTYRGKIWLEDGTLRVRGYLGIFYRTQTWLPAS